MNLYHNIRDVRTSKGVSQAEMARRLDLDPSAYHRLEHRGDKLTLEQIDKIAQALEMSRLELLTWGKKPEDVPEKDSTIKELESRVKELTTTRDILQDYAESMKQKIINISDDFQAIIKSIGELNNLGTQKVEEKFDDHILYQTVFSDKELLKIFDFLYKEDKLLYRHFLTQIRLELINSYIREAKLFLKHNDQKEKDLIKRYGGL